VHVASVRRHFIDRLTAEDLTALERAAVKVNAADTSGEA
jgi:hypothetical protein